MKIENFDSLVISNMDENAEIIPLSQRKMSKKYHNKQSHRYFPYYH